MIVRDSVLLHTQLCVAYALYVAHCVLLTLCMLFSAHLLHSHCSLCVTHSLIAHHLLFMCYIFLCTSSLVHCSMLLILIGLTFALPMVRTTRSHDKFGGKLGAVKLLD